MGTLKISIHGRINYRANQVNELKLIGSKMIDVFDLSFDINANPLYADLIRCECLPNYNLHLGYYN